MTANYLKNLLGSGICSAIAASFLPSYSPAAEIGLCSDQQSDTNAIYSRMFYSRNGEDSQLRISPERIDDADCQTAEIRLDSASVQWAGVIPLDTSGSVSESITLQGTFSEGSADVSEIIYSAVASERVATDILGRDILPDMEPIRFGPQDRAQWRAPHSLLCNAGSPVAGGQLRSSDPWPVDIPLKIRVRASGQGSFRIAIADQDRIESESPLELGVLSNSEKAGSQLHEFRLPANGMLWTAITLVCSESDSSIVIESISLLPDMQARYRNRAAWIWSPNAWLNRQEEIWQLQQTEQLDILYVTVPVSDDGLVANAGNLSAFILEAGNRGIQIWTVIGDPRDVLAESLPDLLERVDAYEHFNANTPAGSRLAGIQLDIEPYLLPGFALGSDFWREQYLRTVTAVRSQLSAETELDLVMPVWWGSNPAWGSKLFAGLDGIDSSVTVMNYRTDSDRLRSGALPFLNWGLQSDKDIRMALESGSLNSEQRRRYTLDDNHGELWRFTFAESDLLVLFDTPVTQAQGISFQFAGEREFSASNLSFGGDQTRLNSLALLLGREWSEWPSYSGIAVHGLEEIYLRENSDAQ